MLQTIRPLHKAGFGILLLKARSKMPLRAGWTTGDRDTWEKIQSEYKDGFNVGVRLGRASRIEDAFLAVVDCDVKSTDPRHLAEMVSARIPLGIEDSPSVMSGRGNGSSHFYIRTKEPLAPFRYAQSSHKVKVLMPSVKPSKFELEHMSEKELKLGYRLRPAWEISVMGEGQQVVLPPSIHPDSGKPYTWAKPLHIPSIPLVALTPPKATKDVVASQGSFLAVDVDLKRLPKDLRDQIVEGVGCDDRSAAMYGATIGMVRQGFSDNEILSVLTNHEYYLGQTAYDHAKTRDRGRAAKWVRRFTLDKARQATSAVNDFEDEDGEPNIKLSKEKALEQFEALCGRVADRDWRDGIEKNDKEGRAKSTLQNVYRILQGEVARDVFIRDEFANTEIYGCDTPWGGKKGEELRDIDIVRIKAWFALRWRIEPHDDKITGAILKIADDHRVHPVRTYLESLSWDGVPRIDTWLRDYHDAEGPEPYLSAVSRKVLVAMAARVFRPGIKYDHVLILEGKQGVGKSTAIRTLASDAWFTDTYLDLKNKDAPLALRSKWIVEMGELVGLTKSDVETLKAFISTQGDYVRAPYGRRHETYQRQCVFIGSTNNDAYLKDTTGNRRFWPVKVGQCKFELLKRDRDQLLAEALAGFRLGEPLWLEDKLAEAQAAQVTETRVFEDIWVEKIGNFLEKRDPNFPTDEFTLGDLFSSFGPLEGKGTNKQDQMRAAEALKTLGYKRMLMRKNGDSPKRFWVKPNV